MGNRRFQIGFVFVEYNLFNTTKLYIYEFSYKFDTVLYQFLEIGTSDIAFMGLDQDDMICFQPITPFIFPLQSFCENNS